MKKHLLLVTLIFVASNITAMETTQRQRSIATAQRYVNKIQDEVKKNKLQNRLNNARNISKEREAIQEADLVKTNAQRIIDRQDRDPSQKSKKRAVKAKARSIRDLITKLAKKEQPTLLTQLIAYTKDGDLQQLGVLEQQVQEMLNTHDNENTNEIVVPVAPPLPVDFGKKIARTTAVKTITNKTTPAPVKQPKKGTPVKKSSKRPKAKNKGFKRFKRGKRLKRKGLKRPAKNAKRPRRTLPPRPTKPQPASPKNNIGFASMSESERNQVKTAIDGINLQRTVSNDKQREIYHNAKQLEANDAKLARQLARQEQEALDEETLRLIVQLQEQERMDKELAHAQQEEASLRLAAQMQQEEELRRQQEEATQREIERIQREEQARIEREQEEATQQEIERLRQQGWH